MTKPGGPHVPREVAAEVAGALAETDTLRVEGTVGGGCIHPAVRVRTASARRAFLKWGAEPGAAGFAVEAAGLRALAARGGVAVPEVLGWAEGGRNAHGWLLLEWIEPGEPSPDSDPLLGRGLAHLHRPLEGEPIGWEEDGRIGPLPQANPTEEDWPTFWGEARLLPQWRAAREGGRIPARAEERMERLLARLPEALAASEPDGVALLHGDLWSGNILIGSGGTPYLVDPAAYRGHREVDLAMMELFGGFGPRVFDAYREASPTLPGYREVRRGIYQLYPLLVHVNLFGGGYAARSVATLDGALAALG